MVANTRAGAGCWFLSVASFCWQVRCCNVKWIRKHGVWEWEDSLIACLSIEWTVEEVSIFTGGLCEGFMKALWRGSLGTPGTLETGKWMVWAEGCCHGFTLDWQPYWSTSVWMWFTGMTGVFSSFLPTCNLTHRLLTFSSHTNRKQLNEFQMCNLKEFLNCLLEFLPLTDMSKLLSAFSCAGKGQVHSKFRRT